MDKDKVAARLIELAKKIVADERVAGEVSYDKAKMSKVVDAFVRFLMGDADVAVKQLKTIGNPKVLGLEAGAEYNDMFAALSSKIMMAVKSTLK